MVGTWRLNDILKTKDIDTIISDIRGRTKKLSRKHIGKKTTAKEFQSIMKELAVLTRALSKLGSYASNWFSENTKNQEAMALKNKVRAVSAEVDMQLVHISQEWKRLDNKNAQRLLKTVPEYKHHLTLLRKGRKHMLSDAEEQLSTIKDINGVSALNTIYSMLTTSFTYTLDKKTVTREKLMELIRSPKTNVRKKAYDALLKPYAGNKEVLAEIYKHIIDDWRREAELRKYSGSISVRNRANEVPDAAVATLLKVCKKNAPVFQQYLKKKAKLLGKKKLSRYDLYAPLKKKSEKITYKKATAKILETFSDFHPQFYAGAKKILQEEHIHSAIGQYKRGGAYCNSPAPDVTPYILISWNDTPDAMRTLAHELGHGIHALLSSQQNVFNYDAPLPICETASIFSELLLNERLRAEKPGLAKEIAMSELDDFYATIMRQAWFVIFEETAHNMVAEHPSVDDMAAKYKKQLQEQFGTALDIPDIFSYEWLYIPHIFHTPFYCYAYSFGNLLSVAFYAQYKKNPAFANKIVHFLQQGGSQSPEKLVKATGFDITDEKFWQSGFDVIKKLVKEL